MNIFQHISTPHIEKHTTVEGVEDNNPVVVKQIKHLSAPQNTINDTMLNVSGTTLTLQLPESTVIATMQHEGHFAAFDDGFDTFYVLNNDGKLQTFKLNLSNELIQLDTVTVANMPSGINSVNSIIASNGKLLMISNNAYHVYSAPDVQSTTTSTFRNLYQIAGKYIVLTADNTDATLYIVDSNFNITTKPVALDNTVSSDISLKKRVAIDGTVKYLLTTGGKITLLSEDFVKEQTVDAADIDVYANTNRSVKVDTHTLKAAYKATLDDDDVITKKNFDELVATIPTSDATFVVKTKQKYEASVTSYQTYDRGMLLTVNFAEVLPSGKRLTNVVVKNSFGNVQNVNAAVEGSVITIDKHVSDPVSVHYNIEDGNLTVVKSTTAKYANNPYSVIFVTDDTDERTAIDAAAGSVSFINYKVVANATELSNQYSNESIIAIKSGIDAHFVNISNASVTTYTNASAIINAALIMQQTSMSAENSLSLVSQGIDVDTAITAYNDERQRLQQHNRLNTLPGLTLQQFGDNAILPKYLSAFSSGQILLLQFKKPTTTSVTTNNFVVGQQYVVKSLTSGDDFTNIGFTEVGKVFKATETSATTFTTSTVESITTRIDVLDSTLYTTVNVSEYVDKVIINTQSTNNAIFSSLKVTDTGGSITVQSTNDKYPEGTLLIVMYSAVKNDDNVKFNEQ